jgi:hypothetical protein
MKDSRKRVGLQLAVVGGLGCYWIVGIWTWTPWLGTLHENLKMKIFWTLISVLVLGIVVKAYVSDLRRRSRRVHGPSADRPKR